MHPPTLQSDKLVASIGQLIGGFADRTGLEIKMRLNPQLDELSFQMQRTLLGIAQEARANVHRHAGALRVRVNGRVVAERVHLFIADDGRGLQGEQGAGGGRGIRGMQDRTCAWGGELRTGPQGTMVHVMNCPRSCAAGLQMALTRLAEIFSARIAVSGNDGEGKRRERDAHLLR
jgi:two-component system, NarL family, sensor kinase